VTAQRLDDEFEGIVELRWPDVANGIPVICGHERILIALAARAPLDVELVVITAGFATNISGQAHIAWHVFIL
jgi:hypothetical protein